MGVELETRVTHLDAEEIAEHAPRVGPRAAGRRWRPEGPIGYTGAYVELKDSLVETEPFVASLLARGPY